MYRISENYCIGGASEPYVLGADKTEALLRNEMLAGNYDRDDVAKIQAAGLDDLLAMGRPVGDGIRRIDVTREGCRSSDIDVSVLEMTPTKECPDDYAPGKVLRHTVDGNQDAVGDKHPDDLVDCPTCSGTARVPMVASDFTDWGEEVPIGVASSASN